MITIISEDGYERGICVPATPSTTTRGSTDSIDVESQKSKEAEIKSEAIRISTTFQTQTSLSQQGEANIIDEVDSDSATKRQASFRSEGAKTVLGHRPSVKSQGSQLENFSTTSESSSELSSDSESSHSAASSAEEVKHSRADR